MGKREFGKAAIGLVIVQSLPMPLVRKPLLLIQVHYRKRWPVVRTELRACGLLRIGLLALPSLAGGAAQAEDGDGAEVSQQLVEVVVTVGTRVKARATADTPVPVDVFGREQVERVNSSDMVDVLNVIVPSFGVRRQPISDAASFIVRYTCAAWIAGRP